MNCTIRFFLAIFFCNYAIFSICFANTPPIIEIGSSPKNIAQSPGYGKDLRLDFALITIIPQGWKIVDASEQQDLLDKKVSWDKDGNWVELLHDIGTDYDLQFTVNYTSQTIELRRPTTYEAFEETTSDQTDLQDTAQDEDLQEVVLDDLKENGQAPQKAPPVQNTITVETKKIPPGDLIENLRNFFKDHGFYDLVVTLEPALSEKKFNLEFPIVLPGMVFREDLYEIGLTLIQDKNYRYQFDIFETTPIATLEITRIKGF